MTCGMGLTAAGDYRVGIGYDVHRLAEGRRLVLGGVEIPFDYGLLGHSDADVVSHSIADALLGALSLGDIGRLFPDTDPAYAGASSLTFLRRISRIIKERGYLINNIDVVLLAERPRIAPYAGEMQRRISGALDINSDRVNLKATTQEGMGLIGKGDAMAAFAVASLVSSAGKAPGLEV